MYIKDATGGLLHAVYPVAELPLRSRVFGWLASWGWAGQRRHENTVHMHSDFRQNSIFSSQQSAGTVFWLIFQSCRTAPILVQSDVTR